MSTTYFPAKLYISLEKTHACMRKILRLYKFSFSNMLICSCIFISSTFILSIPFRFFFICNVFFFQFPPSITIINCVFNYLLYFVGRSPLFILFSFYFCVYNSLLYIPQPSLLIYFSFSIYEQFYCFRVIF